MIVDECIEEFSWLQCGCKLKSENSNFDCLLRGLRSNIVKNKRDCKDIFEGYQEAVRVEYGAHVVEPAAENMKSNCHDPGPG